MLHPIHQKLGTAGFIISIVALVAALGGGAYAAKAGLTGQQKQEVEKIAKKLGGKSGTNGTNGAAGAKGDPGAAGANGTPGTPGSSGAPGASVTGTAVAANGACGKKTGVKYPLSGPSTTVCSGEDGTTGFTETLPAGKTETGTWSAALVPGTTQAVQFQVPISFSIPVAKSGNAFFFSAGQVSLEEFGINEETGASCIVGASEPKCIDTGCSWTQFNKDAKPQSKKPGTLCVFEQFGELGGEIEIGTAAVSILPPGDAGSTGFFGPVGAYLSISKLHNGTPAEEVTAVGAWAVTAPTS